MTDKQRNRALLLQELALVDIVKNGEAYRHEVKHIFTDSGHRKVFYKLRTEDETKETGTPTNAEQ